MRESFSTAFDKAAAEGLVAKRMQSPYCETEKLQLDGHIDMMCFVFANDLVESLENKYVSCKYILSSDLNTFCEHAVDTMIAGSKRIMNLF